MVYRLVCIYPEAVSVKDNEGCTPLALAERYKADASIVNIVREAVNIYNKAENKDNVVNQNNCELEDALAAELPFEVYNPHSETQQASFAQVADGVSSLGWEPDPQYSARTRRPHHTSEIRVMPREDNSDNVSTENHELVDPHHTTVVKAILTIDEDSELQPQSTEEKQDITFTSSTVESTFIKTVSSLKEGPSDNDE